MQRAYGQLKEFHDTYEVYVGKAPHLPEIKQRELRRRLLEEEYREYVAAEQDDDLVGIADALADIVYIAIGTALAYGIPFDKVWEEVHASNMSKLDADGRPVRREDGKVLKGQNYFPPDISRIIKEAKGG